MESPESPQYLLIDENTMSPTSSLLSFSLYSELIKSKQTFLLLYTAIFAYLISSWNTNLILSDFIWLMIGLFFAISGSTLLNMYIDRDIDALMERTKNRPLPSGKISAKTVLKHGILFTTTGILAVGFFLNILTMIVVFLGVFFDVVVYSLLLKRRTRFSILFGGIAGGLPAVAGRTAAIGTFDIITLFLGFFVLCWIPLHILTLALIPTNFQGYQNANIPMWPVICGQVQTIQVITLSAMTSSLIITITGIILNIHPIILLPLTVFCLFILYYTIINLRNPSSERTFRIFKLASLFMVFAFFWLFVGVVFS
ncbi:MAG: protoheme IX farnesyltransferase [Candidatus Thorarchaeota archaeon]